MRGFTRLAAAVALAALFVTPGSAFGSHRSAAGMEEMQRMRASMSDLEALSGANFEKAYINALIPHHRGAIEMAGAVLGKAFHPTLRDAAEKIISDQRAEIAQLRTVMRGQYGQEPQPDARMAMPPEMAMMIAEARPERAEALFLLMMREHHQSAIEMGMMAEGLLVTPSLVSQAAVMVSAQQSEQREFGSWLGSWYEVDPPAPTGDMRAAAHAADILPPTDVLAGGASASDSSAVLAAASAFGALVWWLRRRTRSEVVGP